MAELDKTTPAAEETPTVSKDDETALEEENTTEFEPVVKLEDVETVSGEEDEECMYQVRAKLYRFGESDLNKGTGNTEWLSKGVGELKILK